MKKYVIGLLVVVVAIAATSFTTGASNASYVNETSNNGQRWWNYNGEGQFDQCDPSYYSLDEDNFPDCPPVTGNTYCEIKAKPSQWNEEEPDLTTINAYRMRPLP
jgi:hypothetical protein